jgi:hypothetical protein
MRRIMK